MKVKRVFAAVLLAVSLSLGGARGDHADPAFGPGNGQQNGDKCHPPGQTTDVPGCK